MLGEPSAERPILLNQWSRPRGFFRHSASASAVVEDRECLQTKLTDSGIETARIDHGKPCQNVTVESLHGKLRDECLSLKWFRTRREAKIVI
jgi:hypothetical protein